jgi:isoleucyl-tRNA synthetase
MDAYDNFGACTALNGFVDILSNWYVRRNRDRFWSGEKRSADKLDAYWTLYECLITLSKMIAPFVPFVSEALWRNLAGVFGDRAVASVHLCDYPSADPSRIDAELSERMEVLREIASLGRSARMNAKLKVRQPLALVEVVLASDTHQAWLEAHHELLRDELNVKEIAYTTQGDKYISYSVQPNFKRLGPRVGKLMPELKQVLGSADGAALLQQLKQAGAVTLHVSGEPVQLDQEDLDVRLQAKAGWTAAQGPHVVVVLSTDLTPELIREGLAQDVKRLIQERRKELACQYTDRIRVGLEVTDEAWRAVSENLAYLQQETLAVEVLRGPLPGVDGAACEVADEPAVISVQVISKPTS